MSDPEIDRLRGTTGQILDRIAEHEKGCIRIGEQNRATMREMSIELSRVGRNQRYIIIGIVAVAVMEMIGDGNLLAWLLDHVDIGG